MVNMKWEYSLESTRSSMSASKAFRHAGAEEPAPYLIRGYSDVVPTPYRVRGKLQSGTLSKTGSRFSPGALDSGFRRNDDSHEKGNRMDRREINWLGGL